LGDDKHRPYKGSEHTMIEGSTINLRAIEEDDAVLFHHWINDPEVTRFLGANAFPALSMAQEQAWIQSLRDEKGHKHYTITLKDSTPIGNCELRKFDWTARSCEVGIMIGEKQHWGKGYGGDAMALLLRIAFDGLNMHKVWLTCAAYNERGLRAYRRIGFQEEGRLRDDRFIDGQYHDTIMMSILEDEWRAKQQNQT
jgi:RimJ/RimL family protein N-acetyltransferase